MKITTSIHRLILISALFVIAACGGGGDATNNNNNPPPSVLPPQPAGLLLSGLPTDNARSATVSLAPSPVAANDIDGNLLKTRLAAVIAPNATVEQVNTALTANNAAIVSMVANDPYVTLVIASVADRAAAQAKADALVASGAFLYARPGYTYTHAAIPNIAPTLRPAFLPDADAINNITHLEPGRVPAVWNVQGQATAAVNLLVPDWYKEGSSYSEIPQLVFSPYGGAAIAPANTAAYPTSNRGFHHLGVAAANMDFDSGISPHTGADPVAEQLLEVMAMHTYGLDAVEILNALVLNIQVQQLSNIVPNTVVLSSDNFNDPDGTYISYLDRAWLALKWRRLVHTTPLSPFVHIVAAGDSGDVAASSPALNTAELNSVFGIASGPGLVGVAGLDAFDQLAAFQAAYDAEVAANPAIGQPLDNVLLVGSSSTNGSESSFSTPGAQVRTVGEFVSGPCLLLSPYCPTVTEQRHQTSAAAAQVAGIAAYLWHLDSSLSVNSLLLRLQHAYSASGSPGILDTWIAVLSLDGDINLAALRETLLDVSGPSGQPDGEFTEHDIDAFLNAFDAFTGSIAPDWSVYDLNGDGWTAGVNGARMDLDVDLIPGFATITQLVGSVNKNFDETNVTDQDVLCYYAWSTLYTGIGGVRENIPDCAQPAATPPQVEHAYSYVSLSASAGGRVRDYSPSTPAYFERRENSPGDSLSGGAAFADFNPPGVPEVSASASANGDLTWSEVFDPGSLSLSSFYLEFSGSASASISDSTGFYSGSYASGATATDMLLGFTVIDATSTVTLTGGYTGNAVCSVYLGRGYTLDGESLFDYEELFLSDETGFVNETLVLAPGDYVTGASCSVVANAFLDIDQSGAGDSGSGGMGLLISFE